MRVLRLDWAFVYRGGHTRENCEERSDVAIRIPCDAPHRPLPEGAERERIATPFGLAMTALFEITVDRQTRESACPLPTGQFCFFPLTTPNPGDILNIETQKRKE